MKKQKINQTQKQKLSKQTNKWNLESKIYFLFLAAYEQIVFLLYCDYTNARCQCDFMDCDFWHDKRGGRCPVGVPGTVPAFTPQPQKRNHPQSP